MSLPLTRWAWSVQTSPSEKLVLLALSDCCNGQRKSHTCWPSIAKLHAMTGLSKRSVQRSLALLERRALIARSLGTGRQTTVYRLACTDSPNGRLDLEDPTLADIADAPGVLSDGGCEGSPKHGRGDTVTSEGRRPDTAEVPEWHPGGDTVAPQGCRPGAQGCHGGTQTRNEPGREPGEEREGENPAGESDIGAAPIAAKTLSQGPPVPWFEIAEEVRPDLAGDLDGVLAKFSAYNNGASHLPAEWERQWRLWLLREHGGRVAGRARSGQAPANRRPPGSFLQRACDPLDPLDLCADYEVLKP